MHLGRGTAAAANRAASAPAPSPRRAALGARPRYLAPARAGLHRRLSAARHPARRASSGIPKWVDNFGILILIYMMLGWGLNIVVGLAGLLDLGYVAFYAVGAYSYALLSLSISAGRSGCACRSRAFSPPSGASLLGFPVLRLRGDYLAIVTLAFGEIIHLVPRTGRTSPAAAPASPRRASPSSASSSMARRRLRRLALLGAERHHHHLRLRSGHHRPHPSTARSSSIT